MPPQESTEMKNCVNNECRRDGYGSPARVFRSGLFHQILRAWQDPSVGVISPENLVYPLFVSNIGDKLEPLEELPGQCRIGIQALTRFLRPLVEKNLKSVLLFGSIENEQKDAIGSFATSPDNPVILAIPELRREFPDLLIVCDVCLCDYTSTGMCGILNENGRIDNERSIKRLAQLALSYVKAGCHVVSPSDMLDGRVAAIRTVLNEEGVGTEAAIMSYAVKFASSLYKPFRAACNISAKGADRRTHQLPIKARLLAKRAAARDIDEGADFIIVKPSMNYLDMVRDVCNMAAGVPVATYQVSGEYCMLWHAAKCGSIDLEEAVKESLYCMTRAGASIIITYFTPYILDWLATAGSAY